MHIHKLNWLPLDKKQTHNFIVAVEDKKLPLIFSTKTCEVVQIPLSFTHDYHLVRIINKATIPHLLLDFLSNGTNHYYLDGSDTAFYNLIISNELSLNINNVMQYIDLYISYVYERGNSLEIDRSSNSNKLAPIYTNVENGNFDIEIHLKFQGRTLPSQIQVSQNGQIFIQAPVKIQLLKGITNHFPSTYVHHNEQDIINQIEDLISVTKTGASILNIKNELKADVRILTSPDYQIFGADAAVAYITMPAPEQNAKYVQALQYIGAIKDIDLSLNEKRYRPAPYQTNANLSAEAYMLHMAKNLDIALEMCKMVSEFETQNVDDATYALKSVGLSELYKMFKITNDKDILFDVYLDSIEAELDKQKEY